MAKTSAQILKEIESLTKEADAMRKREIPAIVARIKQDIAAYSLTPADLGFGSDGPKPTPASKKSPRPPAAVKKSPAQGAKLPAKYRDANGNSWTGRGSKPGWLQAALTAGQSLESFVIGNDSTPAKSAKPTTQPPKSASKVKYRDDAGHAWSGLGPQPGWLKAAIAGGKTLQQMAADKPAA